MDLTTVGKKKGHLLTGENALAGRETRGRKIGKIVIRRERGSTGKGYNRIST